jgi:Uma2 family endonuclease
MPASRESAAVTVHVVQGGDGLARRAFSADDVRRMVDAGIMSEDERVELREGELIAMPAEKFAHARATASIARKLHRELPDEWTIGQENTLQLGSDTLVQPDFLVCPKPLFRPSAEGFLAIPGPDLFLIEVADSSLLRDRTIKARLYARREVREYWIIDLNSRRIVVHRRPERGLYQEVTPFKDDQPAVLAPPGPSFQLRIADLD